MSNETTRHMAQSIIGPLTNWNQSDWKRATNWITRPDGSRYTHAELKAEFQSELAKGHEVVPIGECDNFDFKRGCRGHPAEPEPDIENDTPTVKPIGHVKVSKTWPCELPPIDWEY